MTARWSVRESGGWWFVRRHGVIVARATTPEAAMAQGEAIALAIEHSIGAAS